MIHQPHQPDPAAKAQLQAVMRELIRDIIEEQGTYCDEPLIQTGSDYAKRYNQQHGTSSPAHIDHREDHRRSRYVDDDDEYAVGFRTSDGRAYLIDDNELRRKLLLARLYSHSNPSTDEDANGLLNSDDTLTEDEFGENVYGGSWNNCPGRWANVGTRRITSHSKRNPHTNLPKTLREMRRLEDEDRKDSFTYYGFRQHTDLFMKEAKLAKDYEENTKFSVKWKTLYRPMYTDLTDKELRAYFYWRTQWRHRRVDTAPGFTGLLYAYELLALGDILHNPKETLDELECLLDSYPEDQEDNFVREALETIIQDYRIFSGDNPKLLVGPYHRRYAHAAFILRKAQNYIFSQHKKWEIPDPKYGTDPVSNKDVVEALDIFSSVDPKRSAFFKKHEKERIAITAEVFRDFVEHFHKRRQVNFVNFLVGYRGNIWMPAFDTTPVRVDFGKDQILYDLGDGITLEHKPNPEAFPYAANNFSETFPFGYDHTNPALGKIYREIDRHMREAWNFKHPLKPQKKVARYETKFIVTAIDNFKVKQAEAERIRKEKEKRRFTVDLSQLHAIRDASVVTRDALLVDEERQDEPEPVAPVVTVTPTAPENKSQAVPASTPVAQESTETQTDEGHPYSLDDTEFSLLRALLAGKPIQDILKHTPTTPDMLVDSINEKLFDITGDVSLEMDENDQPCLIEDYTDDIRKALNL